MMQTTMQEQEFEKPIRRDRAMIVLDILRVLSEKERRFTQLLYKSNLSCDRLKHYLGELVNRGLVVLTQNPRHKTMYQLTDEGRRVYVQYSAFNEFLRELHS